MTSSTEPAVGATDYQRELARHQLLALAYSLGAAAVAMTAVCVVAAFVTGNFPGIWLIAIAGVAMAGINLAVAAERLPRYLHRR